MAIENLKKREINFWISVMSPIISLAVSWGIFYSTLQHTQEQLKALEDRLKFDEAQIQVKHEKYDTTYLEIQVQLTGIQKDILFIKERIK